MQCMVDTERLLLSSFLAILTYLWRRVHEYQQCSTMSLVFTSNKIQSALPDNITPKEVLLHAINCIIHVCGPTIDRQRGADNFP